MSVHAKCRIYQAKLHRWPGSQIKTWTAQLRENIDPMFEPRVFGYARWMATPCTMQQTLLVMLAQPTPGDYPHMLFQVDSKVSKVDKKICHCDMFGKQIKNFLARA